MSKYNNCEPHRPIAKEILKYLIPFRKLKKFGYPGIDECDSMKDWNKAIDKMIFSFNAVVKDDLKYTLKNNDKIQDGLNLFAKYFRALWD